MQIGSQFPILPNGRQPTGSPSKAVVPVSRSDTESSPVSSLVSFEQASSAHQAKFSKVEEMDRWARDALNSYLATESLSGSDPRQYLIGIDVYA